VNQVGHLATSINDRKLITRPERERGEGGDVLRATVPLEKREI